MSYQTTTKNGINARFNKKVVKKSVSKVLLTKEIVNNLNETTLKFSTFVRYAQKYFHTSKQGNSVTLRHPYTDIHKRHIRTVKLDFSYFENTGYIVVTSYVPDEQNNYGILELPYSYNLNVTSHKQLFTKLFKQNLI
ncbi:hypothetical protein BUL40_15565 [Croceivirga radicis]|uniref:Uncharacterized protein n=1 Tax=Croceivirga radicis TaxID=1929488 RepID=A0A1V6LMT4_9FLAO|nr:hypothetical protein [Croceivirga radicis]OQD41494.1 hypothetical protein BUL40_15565 [Croceivirga radicis]